MSTTLFTSVELVASRRGAVTDTHVIPPITDEMGRYWQQPDRHEIVVDDTHALMSKKSFERLLDYSHSQPSGVYPGKMWKLNNERGPQWWLAWFGESENPNFCSNHRRKILIV